MNEKMSFEEAKKFWQWKWKQIGIKVVAVLFGMWVVFSIVGVIVLLEHLDIEAPVYCIAFVSSILILLIVAGVTGVMLILEKDND